MSTFLRDAAETIGVVLGANLGAIAGLALIVGVPTGICFLLFFLFTGEWPK